MNTTSAEFTRAATAVRFLSTEEVGAREHRNNSAVHLPANPLQAKTEALICVVDHDDSLCRSVARLLQSERYLIEYFSSTQSFLDREAHCGPCCLVLNAHMPGLSGINLQQMLLRDLRTEQIIFVSGHGDVFLCAQAFKAGAVDFLTLPLKNAQLLPAVREGLRRSTQLFRLNCEKRLAENLLNQLTPREREVLSFVIAGCLNKMIAAELGASEKTIKKHRGHLMKKLGVSSVAELVHFSLQSGLKPAGLYGTKVPYTGST